ncbi:type VI secretion system protein TssA [Pantoea sp. LS15]|uniref:type VI secretion system protein TssA n=1 Tax=Enterobacterales TaxID=91347 RepID=UPI000E0FAB09|nr:MULTISPECIES: type VI secretion system protein TssA [Enterobacterales]NJQ21792.1 type VI secretion system protein TssA [Pantoea sp. LS15]NKF48388.1 type VI secretion system protein TssA [Pantoea sp. LS15]RDK12946.1 type VI secretion system protein TssA [Enterobacter sp. 9-2]
MYSHDDIQALILRPAGSDLEFDPQFHALLQVLEEKEDVQYGDRIYLPDEIDWRWVEEQCGELLQRSLDLRIAVYQSYALLKCEGMEGFCAGLDLLHALIEQRWDDLHPQLLAEDDFDPLLRLNSLAYLCAPNTVGKVLGRLPLLGNSDEEGVCFAWLEGEMVSGNDQNAEVRRNDSIERLQRLSAEDEIAAFHDSFYVLQRMLDAVERIHSALCERVGAVAGLPLQPLNAILQRRVALLRPYLKIPVEGEEALTAHAEVGATLSHPFSGSCRGRADVIRALDEVCRYYRSHEPNSPIPLLIERAKKLVEMDFLQIINELTPESIEKIKGLVGLNDQDD